MQQLSHCLGMPVSYWIVGSIPGYLALFYFPPNVPGKQQVMTQALESVPTIWETQMAFLAPDLA